MGRLPCFGCGKSHDKRALAHKPLHEMTAHANFSGGHMRTCARCYRAQSERNEQERSRIEQVPRLRSARQGNAPPPPPPAKRIYCKRDITVIDHDGVAEGRRATGFRRSLGLGEDATDIALRTKAALLDRIINSEGGALFCKFGVFMMLVFRLILSHGSFFCSQTLGRSRTQPPGRSSSCRNQSCSRGGCFSTRGGFEGLSTGILCAIILKRLPNPECMRMPT